jgi:hypothetical protein
MSGGIAYTIVVKDSGEDTAMNASHAIFGGLAVVAAAILFGEPRIVGAQDDKPMHHFGPYRLMTSFQGSPDVSARQVIFRIDTRTGMVSACAWNMGAEDPPACSPWSKPEPATP